MPHALAYMIAARLGSARRACSAAMNKASRRQASPDLVSPLWWPLTPEESRRGTRPLKARTPDAISRLVEIELREPDYTKWVDMARAGRTAASVVPALVPMPSSSIHFSTT
jgi:hypothetical protein